MFTDGLQNTMGYIFFTLSDIDGLSKGYHNYNSVIGNKLTNCLIYDPNLIQMQNKFYIAINHNSLIPIDYNMVNGYGGLTIVVTAVNDAANI